MPEGDTVHLAATRLHRALAGKTLTKTDFRVPRHATVDLSGRRLEEVVARGKHLLFRIGRDVSLHTHLKMDGEWHLYRAGDRWRAPAWQARVVLEAEGSVAVGFRLGTVELLPRSGEITVVGHLGPDLLGPDWDAERALANLAAQADRPIGDVLLDQRVMAGLGNVYKCEICFLAGIDPWTPVAEIADLAAIVSLAKRVIEGNRATGMQITTGIDVPGRRHWVYGRRAKPCLRCGTKVERRADTSERVTYWCPRCQPALEVGVASEEGA